MAIPDYQTIMLPLLRFASDGKEHASREAVNFLATEFRLSLEECNELLPSGNQPLFNNRVGWAATYMKKAALLEPTRRGYFRITDRGKDVLSQNPQEINVKFLEQFPEFIEFRQRKKGKDEKHEIKPPPTTETPEEALEGAYQTLQDGLASDLIQKSRNVLLIFLNGW